MKNLKKSAFQSIALILSLTLFLSACGTTSLIQTQPTGAKVFADEMYLGQSPVRYRESKIIFSNTYLRFEKEGFETLHVKIVKNENVAIIPLLAGCIFVLPWLWALRYDSYRTYELKKTIQPEIITDPGFQGISVSKAEQLRELKKLLDEGVITFAEFEAEKKKILNEE